MFLPTTPTPSASVLLYPHSLGTKPGRGIFRNPKGGLPPGQTPGKAGLPPSRILTPNP